MGGFLSMDEFSKALISDRRNSKVPAEYDLFGPLVGEWDFEYVDGHGTPMERHIPGEWIFSWVLEGTAVEDVFICPSRKERAAHPQPDAEYGATLRIYNPATNLWDVLSASPGAVSRLTARREGDCIVQTEESSKIVRWVFSEITATAFHWQNTVQLEDGRSQVICEVFAKRRK